MCHRITFLYAPLYEHDQLNTATHDNLHELFGVASVANFEHLGVMGRAGHIVNHTGEEVYLPHIDRMKIPIAFVHGEENETWLPQSTRDTYDLLCQDQRSRSVQPLSDSALRPHRLHLRAERAPRRVSGDLEAFGSDTIEYPSLRALSPSAPPPPSVDRALRSNLILNQQKIASSQTALLAMTVSTIHSYEPRTISPT